MKNHKFLLLLGSTSSLLMTASCLNAAVTLPTDDVAGVSRDRVTGNSSLFTNYPGAEGPAKSIDGISIGGNKYLSFTGAGLNSSGNISANPTGFIVVLSTPSAINQFRFAIANDAPSRDPATILIEGTNSLGTAAQLAASSLGTDFTTVYSGISGIDAGDPRNTASTSSYGDYVNFTTSAEYRAYRVIITDLVRYDGNAPTNSQFAELELNLIPEPSTSLLAGLGSLVLLGRRRN